MVENKGGGAFSFSGELEELDTVDLLGDATPERKIL